jgi:NitT/TauT family transport system substrate-binding protein
MPKAAICSPSSPGAVAPAACAYDATMGIGALNDGPIKPPKGLAGRTMALVVTSGDYPFLPPLAEKAGFDLSKVTRIQVDNKVRDRLPPEGKLDAIWGFAGSVTPSYAASGANVCSATDVRARVSEFDKYLS